MPELMVTMTVITLMGAIAIPMVSNMLQSTKEESAINNLEYLNQAVWKYQHAGSQITNSSGSTSNVIAILQERDTAMPGSPFVETNVKIRISSASNDYRGRWNGSTFELVYPGSSGSGQNLLLMQTR